MGTSVNQSEPPEELVAGYTTPSYSRAAPSHVLQLQLVPQYLHPTSMAFLGSPSTGLLLICCLCSTLLISALCRPGLGGQTVPHSNLVPLKKDASEAGSCKWRDRSERRSMIGSTAPICTYNECRGCRFKCSAEQVPVDASDPMNSAYRYRCVCHR